MPVLLADSLEAKGGGGFHLVRQNQIKGGTGLIVADLVGLYAVPSSFREVGMEVKVLDAPGEKYFKLGVGLTNSDWSEISGVFIPTSAYNAVNGVPQLDSEGFINPAQIRNLFINDSYVVADQAARLALTTFTGNVVIQEDTGEVWFKRNNDNPSGVEDFYLLSNPGDVVSVNGFTGVVSITIANLLSVPQNLTDFESAVSASSFATSVNSAISAINGELLSLDFRIDTLEASEGFTEMLTNWDMDSNLFPSGSKKGQRYYGIITVSSILVDVSLNPLPTKIIATSLIDNASTSDPAQWAFTYTIQ